MGVWRTSDVWKPLKISLYVILSFFQIHVLSTEQPSCAGWVDGIYCTPFGTACGQSSQWILLAEAENRTARHRGTVERRIRKYFCKFCLAVSPMCCCCGTLPKDLLVGIFTAFTVSERRRLSSFKFFCKDSFFLALLLSCVFVIFSFYMSFFCLGFGLFLSFPLPSFFITVYFMA